MFRSTRNRRAPAQPEEETDVKTNVKRSVGKKTVRGKVVKTKETVKKIEQDENNVPSTKIKSKLAVGSTSTANSLKLNPKILGSKPCNTKNNIFSESKNTELALKSPVLRDRTNTTIEANKTDAPLNKKSKAQTSGIKKLANRPITRKRVNKGNDNENNLPFLKDQNIIQIPIKIENRVESATESTEKLKNGKLEDESKFIKAKPKILGLRQKKNVTKKQNPIKPCPVEIEENNQKENKDLKSSQKLLVKNLVNTRKRITMEELEDLLNRDADDDPEIECGKLPDNKKDSEDSKVTDNSEDIEKDSGNNVCESEENLKQNDLQPNIYDRKQVSRKFFKEKCPKKDSKINEEMPKTTRSQAKNRNGNKIIHKHKINDSLFNPKLKDGRKSSTLPKKQLRPRSYKNYCEESKLAEKSISKESGTTENNDLHHRTKMPIYKTISLSQESLKNTEEVYDYKFDSLEENRGNEKRRKVTKKPSTRRVKKVGASKPTFSRKGQAKPTKKAPQNVRSKDQLVKIENIRETNIVSKTKCSIMIPEHLQVAGDSTIGDASTIKAISDKILEESQKINLTTTPPVPKTITSELKIFGPRNAITSQPTSQYSNMLNHSLARTSMSPIRKLVDSFDAGSPWRPIESFSSVHRLVQSTPQIKRIPSLREKKLPTQIANLNRKSIFSEDTIHLSAIADNDLSTIAENPRKFSTKDCNKSPKKFGTVITGGPNEANSISSVHSIESSIEESVHAGRLKSQSKSPKHIASKENEEPEQVAGPSWLETPAPVSLKQSTLHNFLNLDEIPESTRISTAHGIFDDINTSPVRQKKRTLIEEANIDNAFGFDDKETSDSFDAESKPPPMIATKHDVRKSVKGKLFPKARVKSIAPSRISVNTVKNILLKKVLKKKVDEIVPEVHAKEAAQSDSKQKNEIGKLEENNNEPGRRKKELLNAVSFSDTFDVLSDNEEIQTKVPNEIPLFIDLEPTHFTQPARRSYNKRKREVVFETSIHDSGSDEEESEKPKHKKKKESKLSKEERKRMQEWVKNINDTFDEIEHFDLLVE